MREIKFRVYNKHTKKMYEVEWLSFRHNLLIVSANEDWERKQKLSDFELMQYSWLKDINWKEIYEGDIVKWFYNYSVEINKAVVWFRIGRFEIDTFRCIPLYEFLLWNETKLEIIWNIYENPDLIK